jgi:hypothetical protein
MDHIHKGLREGARLHAFLSGGGLRVVRLEKEGKLIGYGEHPYIEEALRHADEDTAAGQRDYKKVYGKIYDHYYTGSSSPSSDLDAWVRQGRTFDVTYEDGQFQATMGSLEDTHIPKDMQERVKTTGQAETFTSRGYTYEVTPCRFANGEIGVSGKVLETTLDTNKAWMYHAVRTGRGTTLLEALTNAMAAEPKEV